MTSIVILMFIPILAMAQIPGEEDFVETEPVDHVFDITTLESYKHHPEVTKYMLEGSPDEIPITKEFGRAYDEINLIAFGYEDHIRPEYVEFLEDLPITLFAKHGNGLKVGIDPSQEDRLDEIKEQFDIMYPDVEIRVITAGILEYHDTYSKTSR